MGEKKPERERFKGVGPSGLLARGIHLKAGGETTRSFILSEELERLQRRNRDIKSEAARFERIYVAQEWRGDNERASGEFDGVSIRVCSKDKKNRTGRVADGKPSG